ncbi:MAG: 2'-5' RNA ligase family protein [Cyanobacteria bacterium J06642_11]
MAEAYYSFWLVPQTPDLEDFQGIINTLSKRFNTVPFCPHVTLYSGPVPSELDLQTVLAELGSMARMARFELGILGVDHSDRFAKSLYVQLQPAPFLDQLVSALVTTIPDAQMPVLDPHLSLLYHNLDEANKQKLTRAISLSRSTIRFNQVQVMAAPQTFETQEHVSSLRCVQQQLLR